MGTNRSLRVLCVLALASAAGILAAGCGTSEEGRPGEGAAKPVELHFTSSAAQVEQGEPVTLSWTSRHARELRLLAGAIPLPLGEASVAEGSLEVVPQRTTLYRLEAIGEGGSSVSRELEVRVNVSEAQAPRIEAFTSSPEVFGAGQTISLSWEVTGAERLSLEDDAGRRIELGEFRAAGTVELQPLASTVFTLRAAGRGGEASATAAATLVPRPRVRLFASEREIPSGASVTLRWESEGATEVALYAGENPEPLFGGGPDGELPLELDLTPAQTTVYRLEAKGPGGTAQATEQVAVKPVVDSFASDVAGPTRPGLQVRLEWSVRGASSASISNRSGWTYEVPVDALEAGSVQAPVGLGGSFVLVARSGGLESIPADLRIPLTAEPRIVEARFEPGAGVTAGRGEQGEGIFSWVVEGAEGALLLEKVPGGFVDLVAASNRRGSVALVLNGPTVLRLTASNAAGQHQVEVITPVHQPPLVRSFLALPARVGAGETVELHWDVVDAAAITLERDGVVVAGPDLEPSGTFREMLAAPATYTLHSANALGFPGETQALTVDLGAPVITGFQASSRYAQPGSQVRFDWSSHGGDALELSTTAGPAANVSDLASISSGFTYLEVPASTGEYSYTLRIRNGAGIAEATLPLMVTSLPVPLSFTASPAELLVGGTLRLSWSVADGIGGEVGRLELQDDQGRVYEVTAAERDLGEMRLSVDAAGDRTFVLHVIEDGSGEATTASAAVRVWGLPEVISLAALPGFAQVENEEVEVQWSTRNAVAGSLFALSPEGEPGARLCQASGAAAQEGSCRIRISKEWPDVLLRVEHLLGGASERSLRIGVQPATVVSFSADEAMIALGSSTTLRWETRFGESVELGPRMIETDEPYLDLRSLGGTALNVGRNSSGIITFPAGFVFPYYGRRISSLCASPQGHISLSWDLNCNVDLLYGGSPDAFAYRGVDFGVFFHPDLGRPTPANPDNDLFWLLRTAPDGSRALIVQWSGFRFMNSSDVGPFSFHFQAHFHEDGRLEYRYGAMECPSESCQGAIDTQARLAGFGQIIGYHAPAERNPRPVFHLTPRLAEMPGGLAHRSFTFFPAQLEFARQVEAEGELTISPTQSLDLSLLVSNPHSADQRTIRLEVYDYARIQSFSAVPAEPTPLAPLTLRWSVSDATRLSITGTGGAVLLDTSDPAVIAGKEHLIPGLEAGDHHLTLQAWGRFGDVATASVDLAVYPPYGIDRFEADTELSSAAGEGVVLSWETHGLQSIRIEASHGEVIVPPTANLAADSIRIHPLQSATYTLVGESYGRTVSSATSVAVRSVRLDEVTTVEGVQWDNVPIEFSWSGAGEGFVSITQTPASSKATELYTSPDLPPWEEVTGQPGTAYADIRGLPGTETFALANARNVVFPEGFRFPFGGAFREEVRLLMHGGLTFHLSQSSTFLNGRVPAGVAGATQIHLLPFSQALRNCIHSTRLDPTGDPFIVQYDGCESAVAAANPSRLEFQVALYENGDIEFRYGTMTATNMAYANGLNASIGWQDPSAKMGASLLFKEEIAGGLGGRSWRASPLPLSGTFSVAPSQPTTYEICTYNATWRECVQRSVKVVQTGTIFPTEFMQHPVGGAPRWFEIRSVLDDDLDLRGAWIQVMIGGAFTRHQIAGPDPVIIRGKGGYAILSEAPMAGLPEGVSNYVFGPELVISSGAGNDFRLLNPNLSLNLGGTSWGWTLPSGQSNELSGSAAIFPGAASFSQPLWCPTTTAYDAHGNLGTPGRGGASCGSTGVSHYDVDWYGGDRFIDLRPLVGSGAVSHPVLSEVDPAGRILDLPGGMPFAFPFFGEVLPQGQTLSISSNGFTSFASLPNSYTGRINGKSLASASAPADGLIAPLFTYLLATPESSFQAISTRTGGMNVVGLQWSDFTRYGSTEPLTFQLQLWENGDIVFAYQRIPSVVGADFRNVGIQDRIVPAALNIPLARTVLFDGRSIVFKKK